MTSAFNNRIVRIGIQINGEFVYFEGLDIRVQGQKFASPISNACTIKISNLTKDQRHYILTTATPLSTKLKPDRTPINVTVDVGREGQWLFRLFEGQCYVSTVTQPPDIGIILRSLVNNFQAGVVQAFSMGPISQLQTIAQNIADQNGLILDFSKASPRQIANFSYTTSLSKNLFKLQMMGGIRAYVDNSTLVIVDADKVRGDVIFQLSQQTGMVGVPQVTESGCTAQCLVQPGLNIGAGIAINSKINPAVNGENYYIAQMTFDIANRDNPFFYSLLCSNQAYVQGAT